jgi:hypothetical protein
MGNAGIKIRRYDDEHLKPSESNMPSPPGSLVKGVHARKQVHHQLILEVSFFTDALEVVTSPPVLAAAVAVLVATAIVYWRR